MNDDLAEGIDVDHSRAALCRSTDSDPDEHLTSHNPGGVRGAFVRVDAAVLFVETDVNPDSLVKRAIDARLSRAPKSTQGTPICPRIALDAPAVRSAGGWARSSHQREKRCC